MADGTRSLGPGQLPKSAFLAELRDRVHSGVAREFDGTPYQAESCPWIRLYFRYYEARSPERVEHDLLAWAPEAAAARSAHGYMEPVVTRVRAAVAEWRRSGQVTEVPTRLPGLGRAMLGPVLLAESRGGGRPQEADATTSGSLGPGRPLSPWVRGTMNEALGGRFDDVRVHTGARASQWSQRLRADAFTVGEHVAFAPGRYRPDTPAGDALLAHELAHVDQASGAGEAPLLRAGEPASAAAPLERDADRAAAGALATRYGLRGEIPGLQHGTRRRARGVATPRLASCNCGGRPTVTLAQLEAMTPWELRGLSETQLPEPESNAPSNRPGIADYLRARRIAQRVMSRDPDEAPGPGRRPSEPEAAIIAGELGSILRSAPGEITRPERPPVPRRAEARRRWIQDRVWIAEPEGMQAALYRLVGSLNDRPNPRLHGPRIGTLWRRAGIERGQQPPLARVTRQEVGMAILLQEANPGLYHPGEDRVYVQTASADAATRHNVRHELVHLLGGGTALYRAFRSRYGGRLARPFAFFNEGMTEVLALESAGLTEPPPERNALEPGQEGVGQVDVYREQRVAMTNALRDPRRRTVFRRAYFTGVVPEEVFAWLEANGFGPQDP